MDEQSAELAKVIGQNICAYREKAGLTQEQLAEAIGVGNAFISRVERGQKLMKLTTLYKIASVLCVSFDTLVYKENNSQHMHNIQRLLTNQSSEFLGGIEDMIRVCVKRFGGKHTKR